MRWRTQSGNRLLQLRMHFSFKKYEKTPAAMPQFSDLNLQIPTAETTFCHNLLSKLQMGADRPQQGELLRRCLACWGAHGSADGVTFQKLSTVVEQQAAFSWAQILDIVEVHALSYFKFANLPYLVELSCSRMYGMRMVMCLWPCRRHPGPGL